MLTPPGKVMIGAGTVPFGLRSTRLEMAWPSDPRTRNVLFCRSMVTIRPVVAMTMPPEACRFPSAAPAQIAADKSKARTRNFGGRFDGSRFMAPYYKDVRHF